MRWGAGITAVDSSGIIYIAASAKYGNDMTEDQYTIRSRGQKIHIGTPGLTIIISVNARIFLGENVNKQASNRSRPRLLEDCEALDRWYESSGDGPG